MTLATWAAEFLLLSRRLAPTTQETYLRDLERYVLPRFGHYRLGQLPADEIENWLNDEIAAGIAPSSVHRHYRTRRVRVCRIRRLWVANTIFWERPRGDCALTATSPACVAG